MAARDTDAHGLVSFGFWDGNGVAPLLSWELQELLSLVPTITNSYVEEAVMAAADALPASFSFNEQATTSAAHAYLNSFWRLHTQLRVAARDAALHHGDGAPERAYRIADSWMQSNVQLCDDICTCAASRALRLAAACFSDFDDGAPFGPPLVYVVYGHHQVVARAAPSPDAAVVQTIPCSPDGRSSISGWPLGWWLELPPIRGSDDEWQRSFVQIRSCVGPVDYCDNFALVRVSQEPVRHYLDPQHSSRRQQQPSSGASAAARAADTADYDYMSAFADDLGRLNDCVSDDADGSDAEPDADDNL